MNRLLIFCLILTVTACNSETKKEVPVTPKTETPAPNTKAEAKTPASTSLPLPALTTEKALYLWENCDYIDYVFYELPFSMSIDDQPNIQSTIRHISASPVPQLKSACKSIGRIFYQVKGENALSAEFYFSMKEGCFYLVFMEDNKPAYANLLTQDAVAYYQKAFSSVGTKPAQ